MDAFIAQLPMRMYYEHWAFWTLGGVGAASTALAVVLHVDARGLDDDVRKLERDNPYLKDLQERKGLRNDRYTQTYVAYCVAGAGLLATLALVLYFSGAFG